MVNLQILKNTTRYCLGKKDRLKSRKDINALFANGKKINHFPIRAIWMHTSSNNALQAGFSVSSKYFKRAVDRNRIKRLMREGYRLQKQKLELSLHKHNKKIALFLIYTGKELPNFSTVENSSHLVLLSIINQIDTNAEAVV